MPKSQVDAAALVGAALGAILALTLVSGPFAWMASIVGLILVLVLLTFDQEGYRTISQSLAYSAVCGFSLAVACGAIFRLLAARGEIHLANGQWSTEWLPLTWAFATAILWAIDRARMSGRVSRSQPYLARSSASRLSFIPNTESATPVSSPVAGPTSDLSATGPVTADAFESQTPYFQSVPEQPLDVAPVREPAIVGTSRPASMLTQTAPDPAVGPSPPPILPRTGKETMIYVALLGEGLNVLRSVRAEHVGRDFYKIIDIMPEGEAWEYQPGQVVRCKKKTLSSGKALVAIEEAPRAQ